MFLFFLRKSFKSNVKLIKHSLHEVLSSHELTKALFIRDLKAQYRQSFLGYLWIIIPPLLTTLTFNILNDTNIINIKTDLDMPYPLFAFSGMMLWQLFADSVVSPMNSLMSNKDTLTQTYFPREALILAGLGSVFFNFFVRFVLFVPVLLIFNIPFLYGLIGIFIGVCVLLILGFSIGIMLTPFALLYSDVLRALNIVLGFGMLLTPVVYPIKTSNSFAQSISNLNPVSAILNYTRDCFTSYSHPGQDMILITIISILLLLGSWFTLRISLPQIVSRI